ncbi:methionyl-tRNA formyltransferase [Aureimonas endophytica]|uniref:Methionyl-tRNA formyltransferase n=1 Tax=Aureimonas endophytica TaxID=2027858 RepID=A0A916ZS51_9HYPH|nr:methionyl-tRNA formyltransferase [Aureimonas endophytica]GGE09812.1 methionyl-tRNA formyltransferase [Aureimonas endophytica]
MALKLVFMGTPAFSVPVLRRLVDDGHEIAAVYTQPPRAAGRRGLAPTPSPVETEARALGLDVRSLASFKREPAEVERLAALKADIGVVVAFGMLLPQAALDAPRHGCLNGHASLLPRWRGAAPIQRAIEAGDAVTGTMVMRMEAGLDTGPVAETRETPIGPSDTSGDLHDRLAALTAEAMAAALRRLEAGTLAFEPQEAIAARTGREPLYARKIEKSETRIDFAGTGAAVAAWINAFSPFPGAWTLIDCGAGPERVKLLRAVAEPGLHGAPGTLVDEGLTVACGTGAVRLLELQRAGGKAMGAADFLRGANLRPGARIGSDAPL